MASGTSNGESRFELTRTAAGYVSFTDGKITLVRFRRGWRWEFYRVEQNGRRRGMEMFVRYLTDAEGARLDKVIADQSTPA